MTSQPEACDFALVTPPGRGGIAVIVVSGPAAGDVLAQVFKPWKSHTQDVENVLRLGCLIDEAGQPIDEAVVVRRGSHYEINIHGGPLVTRQAMDMLSRVRAYEPGAEATDREHGEAKTPGKAPSPPKNAFNPSHPQWSNPAIGREMLELLPHARSELVVQALTSQWAWGLSRLVYEAERESRSLSASEQGNPQSAIHNPQSLLRAAASGLAKMQSLLFPAEVVLVGPPNAGKSTLINALTGRAVSIVHERPGTTRDWVRELALLDGVPVYLTDTAGLWDQADGIDAQAVARARERALAGDVVLLCGAGTAPEVPEWLAQKHVLRLSLQADRFAGAAPVAAQGTQKGEPPTVRLSVQTGHGLAELKHAVIAALGLGGFDPRAPMAFTPRQARLLERAAHCLDGASPSDFCDAVACLHACLRG